MLVPAHTCPHYYQKHRLKMATHFLMPIFSSYLRFSDCRYRIMRMAQGTTTVTMLAHQPGVDTSKAVVIEVCSSSASGTAARAVLRRELVDTGRPPNTKDWAHKVTKANARRRVGSSTSLEAMATGISRRRLLESHPLSEPRSCYNESTQVLNLYSTCAVWKSILQFDDACVLQCGPQL